MVDLSERLRCDHEDTYPSALFSTSMTSSTDRSLTKSGAARHLYPKSNFSNGNDSLPTGGQPSSTISWNCKDTDINLYTLLCSCACGRASSDCSRAMSSSPSQRATARVATPLPIMLVMARHSLMK